jgi:hypothetical protein
MIGRRAFGMMLRGLACEGRRRCHKHHDRDRDQRSHFNPHFTRRFSTACLRIIQRGLRQPSTFGEAIEARPLNGLDTHKLSFAAADVPAAVT